MFGGAGNCFLGPSNFFMGSTIAACGSSSDLRLVCVVVCSAIFSRARAAGV